MCTTRSWVQILSSHNVSVMILSMHDVSGIMTAGEFERMMAIFEQMMRGRDNDASVEKAVDCVVEVEGQFNGRNITEFLDAYKREINQRDMSEVCQISSFKQVVANNIQRQVIELQEGKTTWSKFEKAILADFATKDLSRMTRHVLME